MIEKCPSKILIMPDLCADAYAWSLEDHLCIAPLKDYYPKNLELKKIDEELSKWCDWFNKDIDVRPGNKNLNFPWKAFHEQGMNLAKRLAQVMQAHDVEVYYQLPWEDPNGEDAKPFKIGA